MRTWYRDGNAWLSLAVLLLALGVYTATMSPTIDFWDCGEYAAVSHIVGVPHQPGTPLYVVMGRVFVVLFGQPDLAEPSLTSAWAVNFMSAVFSALAAMLVYLVIVRLARRADPDSGWLARLGGLTGALFLVFSDTFWVNAIEAEVYGLASFMMALMTWLALVWYEHRRQPQSDWILLLLIYLCGLGVGFHLGSLLAYPAFFALVWLATDRRLPVLDLLLVSTGLALFLASTTFVTDATTLTVLLVLYAAGCLVRMVWPLLRPAAAGSRGPRLIPFALIGLLLFATGLSVHAVLMIRADAVPEPAINQTVPDDFDTLLSVLRREQYPPLNPLERKAPLGFQYGYYFDFLMRQFSFLPQAGLQLDRVSVVIGPLLLALLGVAHVLRRARPLAWLLIIGYLINADGLILYLNFTDNEVRERDYFYFAAFLYAAIFIGLGTAALLRWTSGPQGPSQEDLERQAAPPPPGRPFAPAGLVYQIVASFAIALAAMAILPAATREAWLGLFLFGGVFVGLALAPRAMKLALPDSSQDPPPAWSARGRAWRLACGLAVTAALALGGFLLWQFATAADRVFVLGLYLALFAGQFLHLGERRPAPLATVAVPRPAAVRPDRLSWVAGAVLILLAALPAVGRFGPDLHQKWFKHDRSRNRIAYEYAYNILAGLDRDAILFTNGDNDTFPIWYLQEVEHFRRDVSVVNLSLVNLAWYVQQLKRLPQPVALSYSDEEIEGLEARPYRDRETGEIFVIYVRDFVVQDIIVTNSRRAAPRPVFFAVTIPQENMDRYYDLLQMEGLAYRLTGTKHSGGLPGTDPQRLLANVFGAYRFDSLTTGSDAQRHALYAEMAGWDPDRPPFEHLTDLPRPPRVDLRALLDALGHDRTDIYRDPNTSNLLGNYPASIARAGFAFLAEAEDLYEVTGEGAEQADALYDDLTEQALISYETALRFDEHSVLVAAGYYPALLLERGRVDSALAYLEDIHGRIPENLEQEAVRSAVRSLMLIDRTPVAVAWLEQRLDLLPTWRVGYELLFRLHEAAGEVDRAAAVVERWREVHGEDDPALRHHLQLLRERAAEQEQERLEQRIRESGVLPEEP